MITVERNIKSKEYYSQKSSIHKFGSLSICTRNTYKFNWSKKAINDHIDFIFGKSFYM